MGAKKLSKREQSMLDKIEELTNDLQRKQAEFENFRKRTEEERAQSVAYGKRTAVIELLPTVDNVERALKHVPKDLEKHEYVKGVQGVAKQLLEALKKLDVSKIETVNKEFDPETMSAVQMEDGDGDTEVVIEELQAGYTLNGEVVRHAMVKVGRK